MEKTFNNKNLDYNFLAVPTNLFFALDGNLRNAITTLLQLQSVFGDKEGYFFRTNEDLQKDLRMGKNLVIAVLESLYQYNLLQVKSVGFTKKNGKRSVNFYKVNTEAFKDFEKFNIYTITNTEELHLDTVNYKSKDFKVTYTASTEVQIEEEQVEETSGNTSKIVQNEVIEETPSNEADETTEEQETAIPDLQEEFVDEEEEIVIETASVIPSDNDRIERRVSEGYQVTSVETSAKERAFNEIVKMLQTYDKTPSSEIKEQERIVKNAIQKAYDEGLITRVNVVDFLAVFDRLKQEKLPF